MDEFTKAYYRTKQTVWDNLLWPLLATIGFIFALIVFIVVVVTIIKCLFAYTAQTIVVLFGLVIIATIGYSFHSFCTHVREIRREEARCILAAREAEQVSHF